MTIMKLVSVVIPTYNRAKFLPLAFESLSAQSYSDFELIIVDDGSTDDTAAVLNSLISAASFNVIVKKQKNQGPAEARNTGLQFVKGDYIAFFDSDDSWDNNHLEHAVVALNANEDIDWIYFAARHVDMNNNNAVILESNFHINGTKQPLFTCIEEVKVNANILNNDDAAMVQLETGLDCAFQNSVIRRRVFDVNKIPNHRIGEDRLFVLIALKLGYKIAFIDKTTASYNIHDSNICDANHESKDFEKRFNVVEMLVNSYVDTPNHVALNKIEMATLDKRIANEYFWSLGYSLQVSNKYYGKGLVSMLKGIKYAPYNFNFYKSFIGACLKSLLRL
jgi:glycosyltransferase involved in cell wall biosynthesis